MHSNTDARAIGHAVATAHVADHSIDAADHALKAVKALGEITAREWRLNHIAGKW